jgi:hypothetical protein
LTELYRWYDRNAELIGSVLRDAGYHPLTREIAELSFGKPVAAIREVLADGLNATQRAMLLLALDFAAWRILVQQGRLDQMKAIDLMVETVLST